MILLWSLYGVQAPYCWQDIEVQVLTILLINRFQLFLDHLGYFLFRKMIKENKCLGIDDRFPLRFYQITRAFTKVTVQTGKSFLGHPVNNCKNRAICEKLTTIGGVMKVQTDSRIYIL